MLTHFDFGAIGDVTHCNTLEGVDVSVYFPNPETVAVFPSSESVASERDGSSTWYAEAPSSGIEFINLIRAISLAKVVVL